MEANGVSIPSHLKRWPRVAKPSIIPASPAKRPKTSLVAGDDGELTARKFERQGSGIITSLVQSDGLVEIPEDVTYFAKGSMVDFLPFSGVTS